MGLIPTTLGTRPRLAVEIRPEGVVAARAEDAQAIVSAVAKAAPHGGTAVPVLAGDSVTTAAQAGRRETIAAVKKALEAVALKERQTTLVLPDAAVRVLLLEFEQLPAKPAEALAVVRFRLKKLLPFDADDAAVSYQVMSSGKSVVRVLAVAVPKEVLAEYEALVREAGFEPGAVLPSTLAACAGLPEMEAAQLIVNAGETSITTAIVQGGVLLLHRTVDLGMSGSPEHPAELPLPLGSAEEFAPALPLVDLETTAGEWAQQQPLNGYGLIDDHLVSEQAVFEAQRLAAQIEAEALGRVPREEMLPPLPATFAEAHVAEVSAAAREMTQALSVAAAYFEDTLQMAPGVVLAAGSIGADALGALLRDAGFGEAEMRVREMVEPSMLTGGAVTSRVPRGWMAGVRGALRG
jgi:type IV pilus assembly protein PilM